MTKNPNPRTDALLVTPEEAAELLSIGRTKLYELMADGTLPSVRIGKSRRVPRRALDELVLSLWGDRASNAKPWPSHRPS
jgi:excisionase family DNA binding protein